MVALPPEQPATVASVYNALVAKNDSWDNDKMGMSEVGKECDRAIWYSFRWCSQPEVFTGPKLRIFKTGHVHEDMILDDLERGGLTVSRFDPDSPINPRTGKHSQWEVRGLNGHLRGKLDGRVWGVIEAPKTEHVCEVKTHNDRSFKALLKDKVEKAKPEHFAQMQFYMHFRLLTRALYVAENKNDSQLYTERCNYDPTFCIRLLSRLEFIRDAPAPPSRLFEDPLSKMAFKCGWCKSKAQCHFEAMPRANCRTCLYSTPVDDGKWNCDRWKRDITYMEQRAGCTAHLFIPALVPGQQIDFDEEAESVTYEMNDGTEWIDGGKPNIVEPARILEEPRPVLESRDDEEEG